MAPQSPSIAGFSILPLELPPVAAYPAAATHYLYLRRDDPKIPGPNDERSLFVTNVPVDSTEAHFRAIFAKLLGPGRFEGITFEDEGKAAASATTVAATEPALAVRLSMHGKKRKREDEEKQRAEDEAAAAMPSTWSRKLRRSGGTAVVLLVDEKSVELALKAIAKLHKSKKKLTWGAGVPPADIPPPLGSQWLRAHNRLSYPDKDAVQAAVDAFFTVFNRREQEATELAKRLRSEPDEDGFVTVTRGGRSAPARKAEAEEARRKMVEKQEKKKAGLGNFYRFQLRERKKAEQDELVRRFDEDRKKVSAMRERRGKFRPES